jgi:chitinase
VDGVKAKLCGQTTTFSVSGDDVIGKSDDSTYGAFLCEYWKDYTPPTHDSPDDYDVLVLAEVDRAWKCYTSMCN